jgi:hypothetical protein
MTTIILIVLISALVSISLSFGALLFMEHKSEK